ncbi:MAG: hypothetical protein R3F19_35265 [Verrucomicrobiales bacterium]
MKTLVFLSLLSFLMLRGHTEESEALREVHKQRIALLEQIAKQAERDYEDGRCDLGEIIKAKVRMNKLQRKLASDWKLKRNFRSV